ncbi:hypothetical protein FPQ18DRAFT_395786 [Pyronema domesticum]|uniref:Uncharacterized protein n=1 Tax=Pyronema omphalodes (strain CBS 100304) TaxID=1076935 RepID=U4LM61_PYROM|nr:hypothetical protein FPQ18DRAFT_395786 [Pyronema domesticum]CCX33224.1 Protein of unknown function [Pyronema omphalodes CBS 100304]
MVTTRSRSYSRNPSPNITATKNKRRLSKSALEDDASGSKRRRVLMPDTNDNAGQEDEPGLLVLSDNVNIANNLGSYSDPWPSDHKETVDEDADDEPNTWDSRLWDKSGDHWSDDDVKDNQSDSDPWPSDHKETVDEDADDEPKTWDSTLWETSGDHWSDDDAQDNQSDSDSVIWNTEEAANEDADDIDPSEDTLLQSDDLWATDDERWANSLVRPLDSTRNAHDESDSDLSTLDSVFDEFNPHVDLFQG